MKQAMRSCRLLLLTFVMGAAFHAFGQEATILGTVTDPSGAVVPNANVTATNEGTNVAIPVKTNSDGQYVFPGLPIGKYDVKVEAQGFQSSEHSNITLNVGDRTRQDFQLQVGNTTSVVNVESNAVQVETDSNEISDVMTGQQVLNLATNGRSVYSLAALVPGASSNQGDMQAPTSVSGDNNVSFNGMRKSSTIYLVDGGEDLDRGGSGQISILPSIDAIAEFRAMTSNYSAEYGLASGATFTMVFKSGTKDFHGTLWEFDRNDALDAGNYFTNSVGGTAPELRYNTYGFNIGGPVFIPKVYNRDRNKTFFFYNMEWRNLIQGQTQNATVPLPSEYGGDFGSTQILVPKGLAPAQEARFTALGLTPGQPFPNNTIPSSLLDPNAQALLKEGIFPAPTSGSQYISAPKVQTTVREEIVRIDHQFNDKFSMYGHWVAEQVSQGFNTPTWSGDNVPTVGSTFGNPSYSGVVHATWTASPTLVNETAFNYDGNRIAITPTGIYKRPSGLSIPEVFPGNNDNRNPAINLSGGTGTNYDVASFPWNNKADDYQIRDDISWQRGAHQLRFGGGWSIYKKIQDLFGDTQGGFSFSGTYTGLDFADFLLGYASSYSELAVQDAGHWDSQSPFAYIQDNWRVNSKLTLNLGLRWDGIPHTYEENNRQSNFVPSLYNQSDRAIFADPSGNTISPSSAGLGPSPNPLLNGYLFYLNGIGIAGSSAVPHNMVSGNMANFGPRVGFAYDVTGSGRTVVRGGFGIFYERVEGNDMYNGGSNVPFSANPSFTNVSLEAPTTSLLTGTAVTAPITVGSITGIDASDYANPRTYQYSLSIQHQLNSATVIQVAYVGNQGRHLNDYRDINLPNPSILPCSSNLGSPCGANTVAYNTVLPYAGFNQIKMSEDAENSHYNGLQIEGKVQANKNLTMDLGYTWSKSMDPVFGTNAADLSTVSDPYNRAYDYGPSPFDRTQVFFGDWVWDIPFLRNSSNGFVKTVIGGWQLSGEVTAETGLPIFITLSGPNSGAGLASATNRPNVIAPVVQPHTFAQWFDPADFGAPALGTFGNLGKGALRGPGRQNWNLSLFKDFVFSEARGTKLELRVETFNTFNHTEPNGVSTSYGSGNFGQVTSVYDPRVFQLAGKFYF